MKKELPIVWCFAFEWNYSETAKRKNKQPEIATRLFHRFNAVETYFILFCQTDGKKCSQNSSKWIQWKWRKDQKFNCTRTFSIHDKKQTKKKWNIKNNCNLKIDAWNWQRMFIRFEFCVILWNVSSSFSSSQFLMRQIRSSMAEFCRCRHYSNYDRRYFWQCTDSDCIIKMSKSSKCNGSIYHQVMIETKEKDSFKRMKITLFVLVSVYALPIVYFVFSFFRSMHCVSSKACGRKMTSSVTWFHLHNTEMWAYHYCASQWSQSTGNLLLNLFQPFQI